jgi:hypothetical protein
VEHGTAGFQRHFNIHFPFAHNLSSNVKHHFKHTQKMLYKAVKVIKTKAPSKNKPQVALMTTAGAIKVRATLFATTVPPLVF